MATQILAYVEEEWMKKRSGILLDLEGERAHQICKIYVGWQFLDHVTLTRKFGRDATRLDCRSQQMGPGTQTSKSVVDKYVWLRREEWHDFGHLIGMLQISFWRQVQDVGVCRESSRGKRAMLQKKECSQQTRLSGRVLSYAKVNGTLFPNQKNEGWNMGRLPDKNVQHGQKDMDTDGFAFPAWKIEENKWRTMGWACDEKSNAVINSLQKVYWWRSTRWHSLTRK